MFFTIVFALIFFFWILPVLFTGSIYGLGYFVNSIRESEEKRKLENAKKEQKKKKPLSSLRMFLYWCVFYLIIGILIYLGN